jgi:hypothetical protein
MKLVPRVSLPPYCIKTQRRVLLDFAIIQMFEFWRKTSDFGLL